MLVACARCGRRWEGETLPFRAACPGCQSWLHACANCGLLRDRRCSEPSAEPPRDPEEGNWCEWFRPAPPPPAGGGRPAPAASGREKAEALWKNLGKNQKTKEKP